jgi:hypothetical protein
MINGVAGDSEDEIEPFGLRLRLRIGTTGVRKSGFQPDL